MILSESEAKNILKKAAEYSKAEGVSLTLRGSNTNNIRFALNSLSTNGYSDGLTLDITSYIGKKSGSSSINSFDENSIKEAVRISENIAKLSPDNPEFVPLLESQKYLKAINYSDNTRDISQNERVDMIGHMINSADKNDLNTAGYLEDAEWFTAVYNSNGIFGYNKSTKIEFSTTYRTKDGTGSSKVNRTYYDKALMNYKAMSDKGVERSKLSANPAELKPGKYTVILEPDAASDMVAYLMYFMDGRSADEGRSYFSKKDGGNIIGEKIADDSVSIYSDPVDKNAPVNTFNEEGMPQEKIIWINNGRLEHLVIPRYWALKNNIKTIPFPNNIIMKGTNKTTEKLIEETDHGILVSRLWYIRTVDPKTILLTGLTRDGIFEIEDGKIKRSIKNFRFNESPANMLKNLIDLGKPEKASASESEWMSLYVPALKIKDFNFSSISDAI